MLKYWNQSTKGNLPWINDFFKKIHTWSYIYELNQILNYLMISKKTNSYYLNVPLGYQKTRSRAPVCHTKKWKTLVFIFALKANRFPKTKISSNFILFDYINRLWYRQWYFEWKKIQKKRLKMKLISFKNKTNINFPILQYKHIIRNFKVVNKKKQKFINHFNLGFLFFEYLNEQQKQKRFNKNVLKKKYSKFFVLKSKTQRYKSKRKMLNFILKLLKYIVKLLVNKIKKIIFKVKKLCKFITEPIHEFVQFLTDLTNLILNILVAIVLQVIKDFTKSILPYIKLYLNNPKHKIYRSSEYKEYTKVISRYRKILIILIITAIIWYPNIRNQLLIEYEDLLNLIADILWEQITRRKAILRELELLRSSFFDFWARNLFFLIILQEWAKMKSHVLTILIILPVKIWLFIVDTMFTILDIYNDFHDFYREPDLIYYGKIIREFKGTWIKQLAKFIRL